MYVLGLDAGGTKTHCVIADEKESILGEGFGASANHQVYGVEKTRQSVKHAICAAMEAAGVSEKEISYAVFGMSGADGEEDYRILTLMVKELMGEILFEIVNDSWIGLYSGMEGDCGVVSICGTGAGHAGRNSRGEELVLRNLDYLCGNYGGGGDLVEKAMHYAFRSEEGTYEKSMLEQAVPPLFGVKTMEEVLSTLRREGLTEKQEFQLPVLVFSLAKQGDAVCRKLISDMGREEGRYAAAVIHRLGMEKEKVPAVLIGSLFKTGEPLLIEAYMQEVHKAALEAYPVIPLIPPVLGAVRLAMAKMKQE